jgi:hypothetical protein
MEIHQQELERIIEKLKDHTYYIDVFYDGKDYELIKNGLYLCQRIICNPYSSEWRLTTDNTVYTDSKDIRRVICEKLEIKISLDFLVYFSSEYLSFSTLRYTVDCLAIDFYGWYYYGGQNRGTLITKKCENTDLIKFLSMMKCRKKEIYEKYLHGKNITLCSPVNEKCLNYIDENLGHNRFYESLFNELESSEDSEEEI